MPEMVFGLQQCLSIHISKNNQIKKRLQDISGGFHKHSESYVISTLRYFTFIWVLAPIVSIPFVCVWRGVSNVAGCRYMNTEI